MIRVLELIRSIPGSDEITRRTGVVAEAVVFSDGTAVLHWTAEPYGTEMYPSEDRMREVRERSGRSQFREVTGTLEAGWHGVRSLP
jgi:hypothetical protein